MSKVGSAPRARPRLLNLGCGAVMHPAWINCDIAPREPGIKHLDFRQRLPFADGSVDVVYHSHVLEHFDPQEGARFLADNVRVLQRGGILRVVVPDFEKLCRHYLSALDAVARDAPGGAELYEWSRLDLLDQMVRRQSCGRLLDFVRSIDLSAHSEIARRLTLDLQGYASSHARPPDRPRARWRGTMPLARRAVRRGRELAARWLVRAVAGGRVAAALEEGLFRASGEVHLWMYDAYSLREALKLAGLADVRLMTARDSAIPGFAEYQLDTVGGRVRRPGSLFAEGCKP